LAGTLGDRSNSSAHDDIASIKQSRPYLIVAQYSVDLVPIFLRDRNPLLLLLLLRLLLLRLLLLLFAVAAAAAATSFSCDLESRDAFPSNRRS
jgi:hypothetical protein